MAEVDSLTIKIESDARDASSALDELISKLDKLQGILGKSKITVFNNEIHAGGDVMQVFGEKTKSATSSLSSFLKTMLSMTAAIRILKACIKESMNFTETFNYFNVAMKEYSQQAEDYAEKVNRVLGINVEQWENAQATFMSLGTTFGLTGDKAYTMSENLTQLVYDLSSLKNVDPTVALQKMRSAFAGEIEPLRAWGVDLSKANLMLAAHELGITKTFNAMTQAEKAQLRYYVIMKQTTDAQGDMARTLSSPANQLRLLQQAATECARALGNIFIPVLQRIIPVAVAIVKVITTVLEAIAKLFGFSYPEIQWYGDYSAGVGDLGDEMDKTGRKAKKLKQQLAGFDEINNLTTNKGGGGGVGAGAGSWADFDLPTYDFLGDAAEQADKLTNALKGCLIPLGLFLEAWALASAMFANTTPIGIIITGIGLIVAGLINLYNTSDTFRAWVNNAWANFKSLMATASAAVNNFFAKIAEWGYNTFTDIVGWFKGLPQWFSNTWQTIVTNVKTKWTAFKQGASDAWTKVKEVFSNIPAWFKDKFTAAWTAVKNVFSTGGKVFSGIKEGIESAFKSVVNTLIAGINKIIKVPFEKIKDMLTTIKNVSILGLKPFSFINVNWSIPQIPKLATGGVVGSPTLAMIGEDGAEAVVPLEHNTEWVNKVAAQINEQGNDDVVKALEVLIGVVRDKELIIDGKSLARSMAKEINRQTRILGEGMVY